MAKLEIGKGSIYTRYPNDTFRAGYDSIRWNSQRKDNPAEWYGTRYEMVAPDKQKVIDEIVSIAAQSVIASCHAINQIGTNADDQE